jgi:hypothetical protein
MTRITVTCIMLHDDSDGAFLDNGAEETACHAGSGAETAEAPSATRNTGRLDPDEHGMPLALGWARGRHPHRRLGVLSTANRLEISGRSGRAAFRLPVRDSELTRRATRAR